MVQAIVGHVFMSYSRTDEEVMRRIASFLRNQRIKVWVDNEELEPGTPIWEAEIEKAIIGASATIVIMSPDSKESAWVRREISYSEQYRKRIFPILARGDEDTSVTLRLITRQFVDIRKNEEIGLNKLSAALIFYMEELEAQERRAREEADKLARAEAEREMAEREAARLKLEREAAEKAAREAAENVAKEKAAREAAEIEAREKEAHRQNQLAAMYAEAVRLVRDDKDEQALAKLQEIKVIDPEFRDRLMVESTARRKLAKGKQRPQSQALITKPNVAWMGIAGISIIVLLFVIGFYLLVRLGPRIPFGQPVYLADLVPNTSVVGFGGLGLGVYPFSEGTVQRGTTLKFNGVEYPHGLFAHAPSELEYSLPRNFASFSASLYIDGHPTCGGNGVAAFVVLLDGQEIYRSRELTYNESQMPIPMSISVDSGRTLTLKTETLGSTLCDWTVWGDAYLLPSILP
jgi:hypothetical protein